VDGASWTPERRRAALWIAGGAVALAGVIALASSAPAPRRSAPSPVPPGAPEPFARHFALAELTTTSQPYPNNPGPAEIAALQRLARLALDPLRDVFGPIWITSGYRSTLVNAAVGGVPGSDHTRGEAADLFSVDGYTNVQMTTWFYYRTDLPLDQVIVEGHTGHLHIAITPEGKEAKRQFLYTPTGKRGSYVGWRPPARAAPGPGPVVVGGAPASPMLLVLMPRAPGAPRG
jgi:hypothetical protein